jgi:hypothetical protein
MGANSFAEFVASQQTADADSLVDWASIGNEWIKNLDLLHCQIAGFLQEYVASGSITYSFTKVTLNEENIGAYSANRMDIKIGRQQVSLEPIGTLFIGCKGRVDAVGSVGRAQILLINEKVKSVNDLFKVVVTVGAMGSLPAPPPPQKQEISWAWKIATNTVRRQFVDLDKEAFYTLLMEISNA